MVTRNRKKEKPYLERDISWMYFNRRILQEATRSHVPLLERMAFLGIYSNNLDEFFRVRVASQSRIAECMDKSAAKEREKAKKLLKQIGKLNARYVKDYEEAVSTVTEDLKKESNKVAKRNLREGDLVFFTSSRSKNKVAHVGIYLKNGKFIHSSTSKGVIVSNLNENYYTKHWISGGRIR